MPGQAAQGSSGSRCPAGPWLLMLVLVAASGGCGGGGTTSAPPATRSAAMGFTYFPGDNTSEALEFALSAIAADGDVAVAHRDS